MDKVREVAEEDEDDKDDLPMDGKDKNNFDSKKKQINDVSFKLNKFFLFKSNLKYS